MNFFHEKDARLAKCTKEITATAEKLNKANADITRLSEALATSTVEADNAAIVADLATATALRDEAETKLTILRVEMEAINAAEPPKEEPVDAKEAELLSEIEALRAERDALLAKQTEGAKKKGGTPAKADDTAPAGDTPAA